jgi:hypothetical protein
MLNGEDSEEVFKEGIDNDVWVKKLNELLDYLTIGAVPEGIICAGPKLSVEKANNILWFLSEITGVIPDNYELCAGCGVIHHTDELYYFETNCKYYCSSCVDYAPVCQCEECGKEVYRRRSYSDKDEMFLCKECRKKIRKEENK